MSAIVIDVETTGLDTGVDRVIEMTIYWLDTGDSWTQRFNPEGKLISDAARKAHGITDTELLDEPLFKDHVGAIVEWIRGASAVIGYAHGFDREIVSAELRRYGMDLRWPTMIDAKRLWDHYEPREERTLQNAFKYFVDEGGFDGAHSSLADARATAEIIRRQLSKYNLEGKSWYELDPEAALYWGPSRHIKWNDDKTDLLVDFGKHRGNRVLDVDRGYWKWLGNQDFPRHVVMLSFQLCAGFKSAAEMIAWAIEYGKDRF